MPTTSFAKLKALFSSGKKNPSELSSEEQTDRINLIEAQPGAQPAWPTTPHLKEGVLDQIAISRDRVSNQKQGGDEKVLIHPSVGGTPAQKVIEVPLHAEDIQAALELMILKEGADGSPVAVGAELEKDVKELGLVGFCESDAEALCATENGKSLDLLHQIDVPRDSTINASVDMGQQFVRPTSADREDIMDLAKAANTMTEFELISESLTHIAHTGTVISLYTKDQPDPLLCRIVSVDEFDPIFAFEIGKDQAPPLGECTCVCRLRGATFQFRVPEPLLVEFKGLRLLQAEFPAKCWASNRRATQRVETPLGGHYSVRFTLHGKHVELPLYDFSEGGVGLRATPREAVGLYIGRRLEKAQIELGDHMLIADLEVRLTRSYRSFLLGEQIQVGCQFVNLSPATLDALKTLLSQMQLSARKNSY